MKKNRLWLITTVLLLFSITTTAHDFEKDGIYYNITSSKDLTVAVTFQGRNYDKHKNEYGDTTIIVPSTVTNDGKIYRVTEIGSEAFRGCHKLKGITIPESIIKIDNCAFCDCDSLISVTIPEGVTKIGKQAFFNCWQLPSITIPEGVTKIETSTFFNCGSLASITIPESVTEIEGKAFSGCSSLKSIILPKNVAKIRDEAFFGCSNLYKIINFSTLQLSKKSSKHGEIAQYAEKILTGNELTTIGDFQFRSSEGVLYLTNYIGHDTRIDLPNVFNENNYFIDDYAFYNCNYLDTINIPEAIEYIGKAAFCDCSALTSATIPHGIEEIEDYTFYKCISLDSINIPETTNYIGEYAFYGCDNLKNITMPDSMTSIGNRAFEGCISLSSIDIPKGITIGDYAFYGCNSLHTMTMLGDVISIGEWGFKDCHELDTVSAYSIAGWCYIDFNSPTANPIYYARKLYFNGEFITKLTIDATSIGDYAFYNCDSLTQIIIPDSLETIGEDAFYDCKNVKAIYCNANTPPACFNESTFHGIDRSIPVYVPHSSIELYKSANSWSQFCNFIETDTKVEELQFHQQHHNTIIYDLSGRQVETPTKGIYIINGKRILIK